MVSETLRGMMVVACVAAVFAPALAGAAESEAKMDTAGLSVKPYLENRFDSVGQALRFKGTTADDVAAWQKQARATLSKLLGLDTMQRCALEPSITENVDCGDYTRQRVEIHTEPGVVMPLYVLIPKTGKAPYPVMLAPHGHGGGGKVAIVGLRDDPEVSKAIDSFHYAYGVDLVRAGFITFCPDARGFGERQEEPAKHNKLGSSCQWLNNMAMPLGQTVTGMWVWDLQRLIDYVETRDDCDATRLGCAGLSGGGLQTLWLTALDERVKAAVDSGYFYGVKQSLLDMNTNCSCNYVPHLWENADQGDLGALIAPRPFMVQSGDEDSLNGAGGLDNVQSQLVIARRVYTVLGEEQNLRHDVFHGPHRWDSTHTVPFLVDTLQKP